MTWIFDEMTSALHDPDRHADALLALAARALRARDFTAAFMLSDRRCRLDPNAAALLLRSLASRRLGRMADADMDLRQASEADPTDADVNFEILRRGLSVDKTEAAWSIVRNPRAKEAARLAALAALGETGERIVADLHYDGARILGWAAWSGGPLSLTADSALGHVERALAPDPREPLARPLGAAARIDIAAPLGESCAIRLRAHEREQEREATIHLVADGKSRAANARPSPVAPRAPAPSRTLTIVVPLYEDFAATKLCLRALYRECAADAELRVVLVDDASPNPAISRLAREHGERADTRLIVNERNLGYAASVNKALAFCPDGDVVLLNADVYLTRGALRRLAQAAYSAPDIATAIPLTNNAEFASFPVPGASNPMPDVGRIDELDAIASDMFGASAVDIPSGVGFCLFVKAAARAQAPRFNLAYARGYFEDVDYCLRLAQAGWRHVVATGVFVGHEGSRSFKDKKRELALRNFTLLKSRFPDYPARLDAFVRADPLRPTRMSIEARLSYADPVVLLVAPAQRIDRLQDLTSRGLTQDGDRVLQISWEPSRHSEKMSVRDLSGAAPQSLEFEAGRNGSGSLAAFLQRLRVRKCIFVDPVVAPAAVLREFAGIDSPKDLLVTDPALGDPRRDAPALVVSESALAAAADAPALCDDDPWPMALRRVDRVLIEDSMCLLSAAWALQSFPGARFASAAAPACARWVRKPKRRLRLGVLAPFASAETDSLVAGLARHSRDIALFSPIVLCGDSFNALALMASFTVHVTGAIAEEEWDRLIDLMDIGALVLANRSNGFGLLERLAVATSLPVAYFDWSGGVFSPASRMDEASRNLALDPMLGEAEACRAIDAWFRRELKPRLRC
ncbi:Glycosyltransferase, GT2 family [Rhodoblastus acidophilus]|uniref:Glycosyltransferase, GT2 family n=2 Tax=Rhodoblastus acidophilus TaxID=1074 RepID=A0A212R0N5_RHOAC|nr:hypothetical protein CKO16_01455 [Rhodoblastus acidophilus]RAI23075.1 hypothetical protein CH337_04375 [Rhodoblastus acidophilus]SNB65569.1 Glycosyltransferase, GT2 family [Rhodoblastus acidophilus]